MNQLRQLLASDLTTVVPYTVTFVYVGTQVPNFFFPRWFVNKFYKLRDENEEDLKTTTTTEQLFNREICESGIEHENLADILTFVCRGDDPINKGMIASRFTCMIGMPLYFNFESRADVDAVDLDRLLNLKVSPPYRNLRKRIEGIFESRIGESKADTIDWNSPAGLAYKESLVLSPLAKRFAMTRIVHETDRVHQLYGLCGAFIGTEMATVLYKRFIKDFTPAERRLYRGRVILAAWTLGFAVWFAACKIRNNFFERSADEAAASYGPDLAEGGLEYYDKMLARNVALRELLGKEGEKRFSAKGVPRFCFANWIQEFNLPFYHRTVMSRRNTVAKIILEFDAMSYEEMADYLESQRIRRRPRKTLFTPLKASFNWKSKEAEELEQSVGVLEYDSKLSEAYKKW